MRNMHDKVTDDEIDAVYENVNDALMRGEFDQVDNSLRDLNPEKMSLDLVLAWLTITLAAADKLPSRITFFSKAIKAASEQGLFESGLFDGLL